MTPKRQVRVAMCGSFDLMSYGDLLFPLVLRHELGKRVAELEVEYFSYHEKTVPDWMYPVSSTSKLSNSVHSFDAVVIGGGHLIRFDKDVAPGYFPSSPDLHHPTSMWLLPAMLGMQANIPVIWSAVGASSELPAWGRGLLAEVLPASAYISVRDAVSEQTLRPLAGSREVLTVPDTVFGIAASHPHEGAANPYVAIQSTYHMKPYAKQIKQLVEWLRSRNYEVVLLPVSPALGDDPDVLRSIVGNEATARPWTYPTEALATIASASAVVGVSLHLSITALAYGVPVLRPFRTPLSKYDFLNSLPGVFSLEGYSKQPEPFQEAILRGREQSADVRGFYGRLATHWDKIAEIVSAPPRPGSSGIASLLKKLPFLLDTPPRR
jgi:lipopolysaccharide transport system ATP-binding protein